MSLLGETGRFPDGKIDDTDEGEIRIAITISRGILEIHFGKPVAWFGMDKKAALDMGRLILKRAEELPE